MDELTKLQEQLERNRKYIEILKGEKRTAETERDEWKRGYMELRQSARAIGVEGGTIAHLEAMIGVYEALVLKYYEYYVSHSIKTRDGEALREKTARVINYVK